MAYALDSKFDVKNWDELQRRLGRVSAEAAVAVRKSNRHHAAELRDLIRAEMPVAGGTVKHRHPESKGGGGRRGYGSRAGAMKASVRSGASADAAYVKGGGVAAAPHFFVNEFGGAVRWYKSAGTGRSDAHSIPVRARSASLASLGLHDKSGTQRGAAGWFFYPTAAREAPRISRETVDDATDIVRAVLARPPMTK